MAKRKGHAARRNAKHRKRLGFVPAGRAGLGPRQGMTISCRAHEVHKDQKKEADRLRCRGRVQED